MEKTLRKYRHDLSDKEDNILSLKQHIGSISDTKSGEFMEIKPTVSETKPTKPKVVLFGTSNIQGVKIEDWNEDFVCEKHIAYTIKATEKALASIQKTPAPQVIAFHSLTNDLKTFEASKCVENMETLINQAKTEFPNSKILISLATPRRDDVNYNDNGDMINVLLKKKYRNKPNIMLSDNSNLSYKGAPKSKMLDPDGFHLSDDGKAVLSSNLKISLEQLLLLNSRQYKTNCVLSVILILHKVNLYNNNSI